MSDINVTPMVDVMLVMLIIFMVITPMLSKGVSVDLVKTKNPIAHAERRQGRRRPGGGHPRRQDVIWAPTQIAPPTFRARSRTC